MPDVATQTHDVTLDSLGLLLVRNTLRRWDLTPFAPQVRASSPRYNDYSLSQFWVMDSWHHGRGALEWEDPWAFYDSVDVLSHIRKQLTLAPLQLLTTKASAASLAGNPVCFRLVTTSATLYAATGGASRDVFNWDNTNGVWVAETSGIAADPTDMLEYQSIIYVATGEANNMRKETAGVWADGAVPADFLASFGQMVLYRVDNINEVYWTTAAVPGSGDWNGPIYVGDTNTFIRGIVVHDGKLYVGKDDGLYYIQDQRAYQLLDFSFARDSNNFKNMKSWNGAIYFPILHGLFRLVGTTLQAIGPDLGAVGAIELGSIGAVNQGTFKSLASTKRGRIVDIVPAGNFLYCVVDNADTSGISQIIVYNGSGWHQVVQGAAAENRIRAAFFTGRLATTGQLNNPRLWFGYANDAYNIILPFGTDDPYEYASQTYQASGTLDSPWFDAGLSSVFKEFISVHLYSEGLTSAETVQISYEMDDIGSFQNLVDADGTAYAFTISPYQEIFFPANTVCKKMRLRFSFARGGTTTLTPKIKVCVVEYMVRPDPRYGWQAVIRTGNKLMNPYNNQIEARDPSEWSQLLFKWRESRSRLRWDDGEMEPGITNLVLNPEFRMDSNSDGLGDNWNEVGNPTTTLSIIRKIYGLRSQQVVTAATGTEGVETDTITTVVGTRYTASCYIYLVSGDRVTLELRNHSGSIVLASSQITAVSTNWARLEATAAATTTSTRVRIVRNTGDAAAATTYNVCAVQIEITTDARFANFSQRASVFCSGDQPRGRWNGRAHLSTSTRDAYYTVYLSNIQRTETKYPSIMDRVRGIGTESRHIVSLVEID